MKIKIVSNNPNKSEIMDELKKGQVEFVEDHSDFILIEAQIEQSLFGKFGNEYFVIAYKDIIYFKSDHNEIYCVTEVREYLLKERLIDLEAKYDEYGFIRISKTCIIHKLFIKSIRPSINMKYIVKMKNDEKLIVTRSYYFKFKEKIGF